MPVFVTVASGSSTSSGVALPRGDRPIAIVVGSHIAREWRVAFSTDSGISFQTYRRTDGTATPYTVASGGTDMMGLVVYPPSTLVRVEVGSLVATTSCRIVELNRR